VLNYDYIIFILKRLMLCTNGEYEDKQCLENFGSGVKQLLLGQ